MFTTARPLFFLLLIFSFTVNAAPPEAAIDIAAGEGFVAVKPEQPTEDAKKVEVMEFFWYGCPHCFRLEPHITEWLKTKPDNVHFIRQPVVFGPRWAPHARAFFTADALGVVDKVHQALFIAVQDERRPLNTEDEVAKFFVEHGVDEKLFRETFSSFVVDSKMRKAKSISARYGVTGVPAVIVNGKYKTNESIAKGFPNMIKVINDLVRKESAGSD